MTLTFRTNLNHDPRHFVGIAVFLGELLIAGPMRTPLALILSFLAVIACRAAVEAPEDLKPLLAPIVAQDKIPGLAAAALMGDRIVAIGSAGVRKAGAPEPIGPDDRFHLGSDTKAMTATVAAMLIEQGKLSWTSTLGDVLSKVAPGMRAEWRNVTLAQLLAHRAGLPNDSGPIHRNIAVSAKGTPLIQRREAVASMLSELPDYTPGTKFSYSNSGYVIVGAMLETVSGDSYESLVRKRLWAPLGMHSGGFNTPGTPGKIDQPWGHFSWGASIDPGSPAAGDPAFIAPAGLAVMTIADWAKFIALHLRGDPSDPNRQVSLITPESFVRLHVPAAGEDYAGGWGVSTRSWAKGPRPGDVGRVLLHAGSNGRSYCVAFLAPEIDFAVIVACNQGGDEAAKACDDAAGALIRSFGKKAYFLNRH